MVNRIILNETSYHGAGAIANVATEAKARGFKKAFVVTDPDLLKFEYHRRFWMFSIRTTLPMKYTAM